MKTSEFIEKVEKLDCVWMAERRGDCIFIRTTKGAVAHVIEESKFGLAVYFDDTYMNDQESETLLNLLTEYSKTPIAERKNKTIEDKAREYIQEYASDHLSFESARDNLECCNLHFQGLKNYDFTKAYTDEQLKEQSEIYSYYVKHSNEFVKMWCEVDADE